MTAFLAGFFLGLSLIVAIGAQNAFILKQGLRKEYVFTLCSICAISDALLIGAGVFGFALIVEAVPRLQRFALIGGLIFLVLYGGRSFWSAWTKNEKLAVDGAHGGHSTLGGSGLPLLRAVAICLALTWLNPHVYLDTVVLIGSVAAQFPGEKYPFALGACLASFLFFFSLGYGARIVSPLFQKPLSWKVLDVLIGLVMWYIAAGLLHTYVFA